MDFYSSKALLQEVLKSDYAPLIKEGEILSADEARKLPDRLYAVVMDKGGDAIRKFACPDRANTALSLAYYERTWRDMPLPAAKVAAANLSTACDWYNIPKPSYLCKIAGLGSLAITAGLTLPSIPGTMRQAGARKAKLLQRYGITPKAFQGNSRTMPYAARAGHGMAKVGEASLQPYVTITSDDLSYRQHLDMVKAADATLGLKLASVTDVERAIDIYKENSGNWTPQRKAEFCRPLMKRASVLGIELEEDICMYGNTKMASPEFMMLHLESRKDALGDNYVKYAERLDEELDKCDTFSPEEHAIKIGNVDKEFGVGYHINMPDPWRIVYGQYKTAEYTFTDKEDKITGEQLHQLAKSPEAIQGIVRKDIIAGFKENPVQIFESLPLEQKRIFIRAAQKAR